jgi:NADH:ubiquinone oxidoreductase subunit F (NADH-binding)
VRLLDVFDQVRGGHANGQAQEVLETIDLLNDVLGFGSLCGLGQMTPNPVRALLRHFSTEVQEHLGGVCRAGVCIGRANGVA